MHSVVCEERDTEQRGRAPGWHALEKEPLGKEPPAGRFSHVERFFVSEQRPWEAWLAAKCLGEWMETRVRNRTMVGFCCVMAAAAAGLRAWGERCLWRCWLSWAVLTGLGWWMFWAGGVAASWLKNIRNALLDHASDSNVTSYVSDMLLVWFFFFPPQFFAPAVKICSFSLWLWAVARIRRAAEQCGVGYLKCHWIFSRSNKPIRYSKISFNRDKFGGCHFCFSGLPCRNSERIVLSNLFLCQLFWILQYDMYFIGTLMVHLSCPPLSCKTSGML